MKKLYVPSGRSPIGRIQWALVRPASYPLAWVCLAAVVISCAAGPQPRETSPSGGPAGGPNVSTPVEGSNAPETGSGTAAPERPVTAAGTPERPALPPIPEYIMGDGLVSAKAMAAFLLDANSGAETEFVESLALFYAEEAAIEGVNHDVAFAQMCLETGFLRFGNLVTPDMNNFCGLGAIGPDRTGERFPDPRTGVRAHIQHLKAYATDEPLKQELVDPRYFYVRYGSSPAIKGLSGTWASDRSYAEKINNILERLYSFAYKT